MIPATTAAITRNTTKRATQPPPALELPLAPPAILDSPLLEAVLEPGSVAVRAQLGAHDGPLRAVLAARHVCDVRLPPARVRAADDLGRHPATDRGRVLVAVHAGAGRHVAQQAFAPSAGAGPVQDEDARPAAAQRREVVGTDVRIASGAEVESDGPARAGAARVRGGGGGRGARTASSAAQARARERLAVEAVAVGVARVVGALGGGLAGVVAAGGGRRNGRRDRHVGGGRDEERRDRADERQQDPADPAGGK